MELAEDFVIFRKDIGLVARRQTCDCCKDLSTQEFIKILELEDAGVAIYRYSPQTQDEAQTSKENEEVFILQNSGVDLKIEEFTEVAESGKNTINCPRCRKMVERAKILFENLPPTKIREVTGVCNHCYHNDFFHCPCCDKIVDKFLRLFFEEQHKIEEQRKLNKSWVSKTEVSLKKSALNIRDGKLEPRTRLADWVQEYEYIPTTKQEAGPSEIYEKPWFKSESQGILEQNQLTLAEDVMERPLKVISFLDFSEEQKLIIKDRSKADIKKKTRLAEENIEKPLKSVSYHAYSRTYLKPTLITAEDIKPTARIERDLKSTLIMEKYIQSEPIMEKDSKPTPLLEKYTEPEKEIKPKVTLETEFKSKQILETTSKPKSIMKKKGAIKPEEDRVLRDYSTLREKRKHSPTTQMSFDTVMKSLSEQNVSVFSYTFPRDKQSKKQIESRVSSSELIKNTQDMLAERAVTAKKNRQELKKKLEEEKKQRIAEKKRLSEEEKRKQAEEKKYIKTGARIGDESDEIVRRKTEDYLEATHQETKPDAKDGLEKDDKRQKADIDQDKTKEREGKQRDLEKQTALKEQVTKESKEKSEAEKSRKQQGKDSVFREKRSQEAQQVVDPTQKQMTTEKKTQKQVEAKPDSKDELQKGDKRQKVDIDQDKTKEREGKQRDHGAESALKQQVTKEAKERSDDEKRAQKAEKAVDATQKQLTTEKKTQKQIEAKSDSKDELQKGDKRQKVDIDQGKIKERDGKQRDHGAEAALKEQVAKEAKEKSEQEKLRKQEEKDAALREKKAQEAEKAIETTQKQLTTENKTQRQLEGRSDSKDKLQKGDKRQKVDIDQDKIKEKEGKQRDLGAEDALKKQVAKEAKEKSEQEKRRKQEEKDAALREKKAQEAEKAIEATQKQLTAEKKIKRKSISEAAGGKTAADKGDTGRGENTAKEEKAKGGKHDDMMAVLREQLAKQKQQELEKERIKKQQQHEKELAEKRLKELESKRKAEKSAIKAPVLVIKDEGSVDENVPEVILKPDEVTDIIIGQKIFKVKSAKKHEDLDSIQAQKLKQHTEQITSKQEPEFHKHYELPAEPLQGFMMQEPGQPTLLPATTTGDKKSKASDTDDTKGVIRYTLSDRTFIDKGWTMLPTEKVVRKMNVYRMRPAKPEFDWFEHNKSKREMTHDTGEKLAEFDDNGRGRWYYRSGELALDYYDAEETNAGQRFVVYSTGLPDERGRSRPRTLLATFDYSGNGIVFDHTGKIRLKYNQTEGVVLDRTIGPVSHWKWHTLNDPPVLQQVMIDTQMPYKDPTILGMATTPADAKRPDNEEMLAIEFENFLKEKRQKTAQSFKPFQIRMKAMKINEYFSLRILDQASIYLLFRDGTTNMKLNIGMLLDHKEIVDTDTAEICEVSNTLDKLPACTDSIAELQKAVAKAQAQERLRLRHDLRLKPPQKTASVDVLRTGCSRPLRTPVVHASVTSYDKMTPKRFKPSSSCNLYYSTQFF